MPSFRIEELMQDVRGHENVTMTSYPQTLQERIARVGEINNRTIPETKTLIKSVLTEINTPMIRSEICAAIELKNTPHIRNILAEMVADGELIQSEDVTATGKKPRYWYSLP